MFGVRPNTLARWSDLEVLPAVRTPGGQRRYRLGDCRALLELVRPKKRVESGSVISNISLLVHRRRQAEEEKAAARTAARQDVRTPDASGEGAGR